MIYSHRGTYLSIVLEFLYELIGKKPQIIGISATIPEKDKPLVMAFVRAETFIQVKSEKKPKFLLSEAIQFQENEKSLCESLIELFNLDLKKYGAHGRIFPSIIFANSRRFTEYLSDLLNECIEGAFGVIHSDVKKRFREMSIQKFEDGELTGIVATSALGEGVDFTAAKGVVQIASAGHPVFLRQRVGRARHRPGEVPIAGIISLSSLDLLENLSVIGSILKSIDVGFITTIDSISAIAKSIVDVVSSSLPVSNNKEKIIEIISRSPLIKDKDLPKQVFDALIADKIIKIEKGKLMLNAKNWNALYRRMKDEKYGQIIRRVRRHFYTVIPFQSKYEVVAVGKWVKIGDLDPEFVSTRIRPLMTFQLAGRNLRVIKIDHINLKIYVEEIEKTQKIIPFWFSPPIIRMKEIAEKMLDPNFIMEVHDRMEILYKSEGFEKAYKEVLKEIELIKRNMPNLTAVVSEEDEGYSITIISSSGEGGNRYAAYALASYFQEIFGPWSQPDIKISPISFTLTWRFNRPTREDFLKVVKAIEDDSSNKVKNVIGDYGRVEASLNQILDGIARGAYRLPNLNELAWNWIELHNYLGILDKEEGELILKKLRDGKITWVTEDDIRFLLEGIEQIPDERMGYKAYREVLKTKIIEVMQHENRPLSLDELASITGYKRSQRVLYEILYSLINERKVRVIYDKNGFDLPAKVQIFIRKYGKTKQFPVILPGKLLYELGEPDMIIDYPVQIEPEFKELIIKAESSVAEAVERNLIGYLDREIDRIKELLLRKIGEQDDTTLFENIPKIKIIVEIPPPKEYAKKEFKRLDEIKDVWSEIKKYEKEAKNGRYQGEILG